MAIRSVRVKILINLILLTVLFGLGMVGFAETVISQKLQGKMLEKGVAIARKIASDCVNPIITERYFEITMMLKDQMASEKDIVYAYVLDDAGRPVANTFRKGVPTELIQAHKADLRLPFSTKKLSTDEGEVYDIAVPLLHGEAGVLHLGLSDKSIVKDVNDIVTAFILFSLAVLVAGTLIAILFSRTITRPLLQLARAAEAYGRSETNYHLRIESGDEIGELAQIFNTMIERRRQTDAEREKLIQELQDAMGKIKTLSGLLPICASCKKIRDDKGYWKQIESYISDHSSVEFSHSICPECAKKLYPQILDEDGNLPDRKT